MMPSSSPFINGTPSSGFPFSSLPFSSSTGPTFTSSATSSVFAPFATTNPITSGFPHVTSSFPPATSSLPPATFSFPPATSSFPTSGFSQSSQAMTNGKVAYAFGGSLKASYHPTWEDPNATLVSISAMPVYSDKSHEELRLEDYQFRNEGGYLPFSNQKSQPTYRRPNPFAKPSWSGASLFNPTPSSGVKTDSSQNNPFKFPTTTSTMGKLSTGASSSSSASQAITPDSGCSTCKHFQSSSVSQMNQTFNPPNPFRPPLLPSVGQIPHPFGLGTPYGASPLPEFANFTNPNVPALGSSNPVFVPQPLVPMLWPPVFCFPPWAPVFCFPPPFVNAPTSDGTPNGASVGPGGPTENETKATGSERVNDPETVASSLADVHINEKEKDDSCIPEGLRMIVEKLGFNLWDKGEIGEGAKLDLSRCILPCEEAETDEDIIALAQFAVEQHNAMIEEGKVEMVGVIGASLEPVKGGRYHIVLKARDPNNEGMPCGEPKRYYARVMRQMNHLALLEKWLPGKN